MPQNMMQLPKNVEINVDKIWMEMGDDGEVINMDYYGTNMETKYVSYEHHKDIFNFISEVLLDGNNDFFEELDKHGITYGILADICAGEIEKDDNNVPVLMEDSFWNSKDTGWDSSDIYESVHEKRVENGSMSEEKFEEYWYKVNPKPYFEKEIESLEKFVKKSCVEMIRNCESWDELRTQLRELLVGAKLDHDESRVEAYTLGLEQVIKKAKTLARKKKKKAAASVETVSCTIETDSSVNKETKQRRR